MVTVKGSGMSKRIVFRIFLGIREEFNDMLIIFQTPWTFDRNTTGIFLYANSNVIYLISKFTFVFVPGHFTMEKFSSTNRISLF